MHPILVRWDTPEFLHGFLPATVTIYSYGVLVLLGAVLAYAYTARQALRTLGVAPRDTLILMLWLIVAAYVGGRLFFVLEEPAKYAGRPADVFSGGGFVFYGSALFAIPTILLFARVRGLPAWSVFDLLAITTCIVHMVGRVGCLMAGCCYGRPHDGALSITFAHTESLARPLHTPLWPTQPFSVTTIALILAALLAIRKRQRFGGQVAASYLILYGLGRFVIEFYRGDEERGFLFDGTTSHAQAISILAMVSGSYLYLRLRSQRDTQHSTGIS